VGFCGAPKGTLSHPRGVRVYRVAALIASGREALSLCFLLTSVMVMFTEALQVGWVEEQCLIALMGLDVVNDCSRCHLAAISAHDTQRAMAELAKP